MSFGKASAHRSNTDTDVVLASVKEQEIQFERLTRELEEEHLNVADQLQQCKLQSHNNIASISSDEQVEVSDTESRRDSELNPGKNNELTTHSLHQANSNKADSSKIKLLEHGTPQPTQNWIRSPAAPIATSGRNLMPTIAHPSPYYAAPPAYLSHPSYKPATFLANPQIYSDVDYITAYAPHPYDTYQVHTPFQQSLYQAAPPAYAVQQARHSLVDYQQFNYPPHSHPTHHAYVEASLPQEIHHAGYWPTPVAPPVPRRYREETNDIYENVMPPRTSLSPQVQNLSSMQEIKQDVVYPLQRASQLRPTHQANRLSDPQYFDEQNSHGVRYDNMVTDPKKDGDRDPGISVVIQMLRHHSYQVVANAAAYIQHLTFSNDHMKVVLRKKGVIPLLVNLLHHHVVQVQRNACGALRNMVYGRSNDEAKAAVGKCGGISSLAHVLRNTDDPEMKELITGVLWNLSSCDEWKNAISDSALFPLVSRVVVPHVSLIEPQRMSRYGSGDVSESDAVTSNASVEPNWPSSFINATGCLRNISSAGADVRGKMRDCDGLVEALLLVIENVVGKKDVDGKGVENCMCILRNLTYRLAVEVEAAHVPINRGHRAKSDVVKDEDCWRRKSKKERKKSKDAEVIASTTSSNGVELLWQPAVVYYYLTLLSETCNLGTLEAVTGALQNLSAGQWVWSAEIRATVRKEKGLPMLVEFMHMESERIVTGMCAALRNMALDERNKELLGKHAMQHFVDLLPTTEASALQENDSAFVFPQPQKVLLLESACTALLELISNNSENATRAHSIGIVPRLLAITKSIGCRYPHRTVKTAGRVLAALWEHKQIRSALKNQGWSRYHFALSIPSVASASSQASPMASAPVSPDDLEVYHRRTPSSGQRSSSQHPSPPRSSPHYDTKPQHPSPPRSSAHYDTKSHYVSKHDNSDYVTIIKRDEADLCPVDSWV